MPHWAAPPTLSTGAPIISTRRRLSVRSIRGFLARVNTRAIGNLIIELGGGRKALGEALDLSVGLSEVAPIGAWLDAERPLAVVHAASDDAAARAEAMLLEACELSAEAPPEAPTILEIIAGNP